MHCLLLYFNTNKPHSFFGRIPVVLENRRSFQREGGVRTPCTLPLDPPLQSFLVLSGLLYIASGRCFIWFGLSPIRRKLKKGTYSDFVFPWLFSFCDSGIFAQEIIPVLRWKNRALRLATLNLILTQVCFLIMQNRPLL